MSASALASPVKGIEGEIPVPDMLPDEEPTTGAAENEELSETPTTYRQPSCDDRAKNERIDANRKYQQNFQTY